MTIFTYAPKQKKLNFDLFTGFILAIDSIGTEIDKSSIQAIGFDKFYLNITRLNSLYLIVGTSEILEVAFSQNAKTYLDAIEQSYLTQNQMVEQGDFSFTTTDEWELKAKDLLEI